MELDLLGFSQPATSYMQINPRIVNTQQARLVYTVGPSDVPHSSQYSLGRSLLQISLESGQDPGLTQDRAGTLMLKSPMLPPRPRPFHPMVFPRPLVVLLYIHHLQPVCGEHSKYFLLLGNTFGIFDILQQRLSQRMWYSSDLRIYGCMHQVEECPTSMEA